MLSWSRSTLHIIDTLILPTMILKIVSFHDVPIIRAACPAQSAFRENYGRRNFSKLWREGSMYPYVMWSSTYLYKLFRNSTCLYFFQVALLGTIYWKPLPLLIMGGSALIGGIIALLFLPETLGKPLPETMEDAVNLSRSRNGRTIFRWNIEILVVYLKKDCQAICCMCKMSTKIVHKNTRTC